jgi:flavin-dependent dehydrogenase
LGQTFEYETESIEALVIDRHLFDQSLCESAHEAGVELSLGYKVTKVAVQSTHIEVECSGGERVIRARVGILATGASYGLQRSLGFGLPPLYLNSAQVELPVSSPGDVELHFGTQVAPQGFAWVVPVRRQSGDHARIGLMCQGDPGQYFDSFLDRAGKRWGVKTNGDILPRQRILPLSPIRKTFADRLLVVGDAAGLVKPTTGGGIYYSLVSAAIAAEVLTDALRRDRLGESALGEYEKRWRERLAEEFQAQLTLRLLAQRLSDAEIEELFELASTDGLIPLVRKTAKFNQHRDLIVALVKYPATRRILFKRLVR